MVYAVHLINFYRPDLMEGRQRKIKDTAMILLAWLVALSLAYSAYLKFRLLFH
jgi:hypothetical protein